VATGIGSYAINQGTVTNASNTNYNITNFTSAALTVTKRDITVTADNKTRKYGNSIALTWTVGADGLVNGDTLSGALATLATEATSIGTYAVTRGTLAASANYNVTVFTPGTLTIIKRDISFIANNKVRNFGSSNPTLTYTVGGDGLYGSDVLIKAPNLTTTANTLSLVGAYPITVSGAVATSNYSITGYTLGTLTIYPLPEVGIYVPTNAETLALTREPKTFFNVGFETVSIVDAMNGKKAADKAGVEGDLIQGLDEDESVKVN
jgi:hypothetical protein